MDFTRLKLYHCPATRSARVKWLLHELIDDEFDVENVPLYDCAQYRPEYLEKNPNHNVPSLEITLDFDIDILKEPVKDQEDELFGQKVIKINPSDKATVEVMVKNTGNLNDTYNLRIEGHQYFPDWEAYFTDVNSDQYDEALQLDAIIMEKQFPSKFQHSAGDQRAIVPGHGKA